MSMISLAPSSSHTPHVRHVDPSALTLTRSDAPSPFLGHVSTKPMWGPGDLNLHALHVFAYMQRQGRSSFLLVADSSEQVLSDTFFSPSQPASPNDNIQNSIEQKNFTPLTSRRKIPSIPRSASKSAYSFLRL